jgi:hypothetical protein
MLDQVIFTCTDTLMGIAADRIGRLTARLGRFVAGFTALSCLAFLALPWVAAAQGFAPALFLGLVIVWAASSSALRAPLMMLLGKYATAGSIPWLASVALLGLGIAGAVAPYVTVTLRGVDPRWPFALASAALVMASLGLLRIERWIKAAGGDAASRPAMPAPRDAAQGTGALAVFLPAILVLAVGAQIHGALNSAPQFLRFAKPADLELLLPIFWIGFNIAMFPASRLAERWGAPAVMGVAALLGAAALYGAGIAQSLASLTGAQLAAGAAWGAVMMGALSAALLIGRSGHEGRVTGLMFSCLAMATLARMAAVAGGVPARADYAEVLRWAPPVCWLLGGAALLALALAPGGRRAARVST